MANQAIAPLSSAERVAQLELEPQLDLARLGMDNLQALLSKLPVEVLRRLVGSCLLGTARETVLSAAQAVGNLPRIPPVFMNGRSNGNDILTRDAWYLVFRFLDMERFQLRTVNKGFLIALGSPRAWYTLHMTTPRRLSDPAPQFSLPLRLMAAKGTFVNLRSLSVRFESADTLLPGCPSLTALSLVGAHLRRSVLPKGLACLPHLQTLALESCKGDFSPLCLPPSLTSVSSLGGTCNNFTREVTQAMRQAAKAASDAKVESKIAAASVVPAKLPISKAKAEASKSKRIPSAKTGEPQIEIYKPFNVHIYTSELVQLPALTSLKITYLVASDMAPLANLINLRELRMPRMSLPGPLDLGNLQMLEHLSCECYGHPITMDEMPRLHTLVIGAGFTGLRLERLPSLTSLGIARPTKDNCLHQLVISPNKPNNIANVKIGMITMPSVAKTIKSVVDSLPRLKTLIISHRSSDITPFCEVVAKSAVELLVVASVLASYVPREYTGPTMVEFKAPEVKDPMLAANPWSALTKNDMELDSRKISNKERKQTARAQKDAERASLRDIREAAEQAAIKKKKDKKAKALGLDDEDGFTNGSATSLPPYAIFAKSTRTGVQLLLSAGHPMLAKLPTTFETSKRVVNSPKLGALVARGCIIAYKSPLPELGDDLFA